MKRNSVVHAALAALLVGPLACGSSGPSSNGAKIQFAASGEVLVSRTVVDLIAGSGIQVDDRGEHELKGLPGTWRLYSVSG